MKRFLTAAMLWGAIAAPAAADLGDTWDQAKARVRARQDVVVLEVWRDRKTMKVVRERWRCGIEAGWTYAQAAAICRQVLHGKRPVTALHHGLGPLNGATMYYDQLLTMSEDGDPVYGGLTRADYEHCGPGRVRQINIQGEGYAWFLEQEALYTYSRHLVEENLDEHEET